MNTQKIENAFPGLEECRKKAGLTKNGLGAMVGLPNGIIGLLESNILQRITNAEAEQKLLAFIEKWKDVELADSQKKVQRRKRNPAPQFIQLRECRKKAGYTQHELGSIVGTTQEEICSLESGSQDSACMPKTQQKILAFIEKWKDAEPAEGPYAKLKECRKKAMLTQSELGEMVGLGNQTISHLETGKQRKVVQEEVIIKLLLFIEKWEGEQPYSPFLQLKACREKAGLTQVQLAGMVGLHHNQISMYESGINEPRIGSSHRRKLLAFIDEWRDDDPHSPFLELKVCRKKAGLTQQELAERVGVCTSQISVYESGIATPKFGSPHRRRLLAFVEEWRDNDPHFPSSQLKACRKRAGLTQVQLADMVGLYAAQILVYESGLVVPKINSPHTKKLLAFIDEYRL